MPDITAYISPSGLSPQYYMFYWSYTALYINDTKYNQKTDHRKAEHIDLNRLHYNELL